MLITLMFVIVLCLFVGGMNFSVWLYDNTKTRNLVFAVVNLLLGIFNLVALVGRAANL
jgi:hypothetical protein